ncbi:hypothetical protein ACQP1K_03415 [Sphaerimonospora sp. CA-214678]|uniref:hypothetical protein n=1 Tax=Sphaerimonospora sp. CA-214678 TaxID=3240029 RepID=UPI003D89B8CC
MTIIERFTDIFREEHREVRAPLLSLIRGLDADHDAAIRDVRDVREPADLDSLEPARTERAVHPVRRAGTVCPRSSRPLSA